MKFLVDAQLPRRLALRLSELGFDTRHTLDLPEGNQTTDRQLMEAAEREDRIIVTKDADFVDSHLLNGKPEKLLLVATGNIANTALLRLIDENLPAIVSALGANRFVELGRIHLFIHD